MKILIADDDRVQTLMLSTHLRVKGFKVDLAYGAIQAWISAIRTLPDAIIPDIQMSVGSSSVGFTSGLVHSNGMFTVIV
jgi:DNA-binding response OmpR family regulator